MKTSLAHLPLRKQRELVRITARIRQMFADYFANTTSKKKKSWKIEQIILFGSYARTDNRWVDEPLKGRGYQSDYDFLILVNQQELADDLGGVWSIIGDKLMEEQMIRRLLPETNFIVHTARDMQSMLDKGRFFFVDIFEQGVQLYAAEGHRTLIPPQNPLPEAVRRAEAKVHYEEWFPHIEAFLHAYKSLRDTGHLKLAAFLLHQATESAYACFLLVKTNYLPLTHNIKALRSFCEGIEPRLIRLWPRATRAERRPFNKLKDAYVKARYSRYYQISGETLTELEETVVRLQAMVKEIEPK